MSEKKDSKEAKPRKRYKCMKETVEYAYDAGDNRFGMSKQPGAIAEEVLYCAKSVEEAGEWLEVSAGGSSYKYYAADFKAEGC